jgi:hypothetical protein
MGKFAETEIIGYRLSFADQGKQTSIFSFRLQQINGSLPFPFSACGIPKTWRHGDVEMETWKHGNIDMRHGNMEKWRYGDMEMETRNFKNEMQTRSPGDFP